MMWILLTLFSAACLCAAQDSGGPCQCISYIYCLNYTKDDNTLCESPYEECCYLPFDIGGSLTMTTSTPPPPPPQPPPSPSPSPNVPLSDNKVCGRRNNIIDWKVCCFDEDTDTKYGEFPWMVSVNKVNPSGTQEILCGGSIIDPYVILSSAHTFKGLTADQLSIKAGVWNTTDFAEMSKHQDRSVAKLVLHPEYSKAKVSYDYALLFLKDRLDLNDENVAAICLPGPDLKANPSSCVATGWGSTSSDDKNVQSTLKKVDLPLVEFSACETKLQSTLLGTNFKLHPSFICAGRENADTCKGDGGGPLMCTTFEDPDRYFQVGITSWGVGCNKGVPGVYSNVQAVSSWIQSQIDAYYSSMFQLRVKPDQ